MSQKRRGLGRGLGALIPSSPAGSRPSDVFFEGSPSLSPDSAGAGVQAAGGKEVPANTEAFGGSTLADEDTSNVSRETTPAGSHAPDRAGAAGQQEIANSDAFGKRPSDEPSGTAGASGRGDAATSQGDDANGAGLLPVPGARFLELDPALIHPNSKQPRVDFDEDDLAELISSIGEVGVLQPVIVRPSREDDGHYELIMGERRWRATQAAGLPTIPAIVRDTDDEDLLRDALLENLHRSALNPLEEAAAYQQLLDDFGCTHEELSTRIARSTRRSRTPSAYSSCRRWYSAGLPPVCCRRVMPGRCFAWTIPRPWSGLHNGLSPRVSQCVPPRRLPRWVASSPSRASPGFLGQVSASRLSITLPGVSQTDSTPASGYRWERAKAGCRSSSPPSRISIGSSP